MKKYCDMSEIKNKRKAVLNQMTKSLPSQIGRAVSKFKNYEWLVLALDEGLFNICKWKNNPGGYVAFSSLISKFSSSIKGDLKLRKVLISFLSFKDDEYIDIVKSLTDVYLEENLASKLVKSLNFILKNRDSKRISAIETYIRFIHNASDMECKTLDMKLISSFYINSMLIGYKIESLRYCGIIYESINNNFVEYCIDRLACLSSLDEIYGDNPISHTSLNNVHFNEKCELELADFGIDRVKKDYMFSDAKTYIGREHSGFLRRDTFIKELDILLAREQNLDYIIKMMAMDSVYYKKMSMYFAQTYFNKESKIVFLNNIDDFGQLISKIDTSKILCDLLNDNYDALDESAKNRVDKVFEDYKSKSIKSEDGGLIIRAYNALKTKLDLRIDLPDNLKDLYPIEGIGKVISINSTSFIDDDKIINDLNYTILELNSIYLEKRIEFYKEYEENADEKNYYGTLKRILDVYDGDISPVLDESVLSRIEDDVFFDIVKLFKNVEITFILGQYLNRLVQIQFLDLNSDNVNRQLRLAYSFSNYIGIGNEYGDQEWKIIYKIIAKFRDLQNNNTEVSIGDFDGDIIMECMNTATHVLFRSLIGISNEENIKCIYLKLKNDMNKYSISVIGSFYHKFKQLLDEEIIKTRKNDDDLEIAFTTFLICYSHIYEDDIDFVNSFLYGVLIDKNVDWKDGFFYKRTGMLVCDMYLYDGNSCLIKDLLSKLKDNGHSTVRVLGAVISRLFQVKYSEHKDKIDKFMEEISQLILILDIDNYILSKLFVLLTKLEINSNTTGLGSILSEYINEENASDSAKYYNYLFDSEISSDKIETIKAKIKASLDRLDVYYYPRLKI